MRALLVDVQGTATDFFSTVCGEARRVSAGRFAGVEWGDFVTRWRAGYFAALEGAVVSRDAWVSVHSVYRRELDRLLEDEGIVGFSEEEREDLATAWQRLEPWPDVIEGLGRLRERFVVATLSNADVSAVVNLSKRGGLVWDAVFAAEMAGAFKPDPVIYRMAAAYLGLPPEEIMMVACHKYDLRAAAALGFRTAFVARPDEFGPGGDVDVEFDDAFDVNAVDFLDLAARLGC